MFWEERWTAICKLPALRWPGFLVTLERAGMCLTATEQQNAVTHGRLFRALWLHLADAFLQEGSHFVKLRPKALPVNAAHQWKVMALPERREPTAWSAKTCDWHRGARAFATAATLAQRHAVAFGRVFFGPLGA